MSDVWDSFNRQLEVGDGIGRQIRDRRAYNDGGLSAVEEAAGQAGDMAGMENTREMQRRQTRFQDERTQNAYERMNQIGPRARNIIRATRNMDPQRAGAFLNQNRRFFEDWGFSPEQVDSGIAGLTNADPAIRQQWVEQLDAAFRQHEDPNWRLATVPTENGAGVEQRAVALGPDGEILRGEGSMPVAPGDVESFGSGGLYRNNPNNPNGYEVLREPRSVAAGGSSGAGYSIVDPAEVEALGLPPGSYQRNNATGQITVLGRQRGQYTESASSSAQYASRMAAADQTLSRLEDANTDPAGVYVARLGAGSQEERRVRQAQREFVNAILRRESGAVIADSEFASAAQQYFPQPGDGPAVVAQKRAARQRALQGLINASQGAYDEWYGEGSGAELATSPPPGSIIGEIAGRATAPQQSATAPQQPRPDPLGIR